MGTGSAAFYHQPYGTRLPVPAHRSELNQASMCDDHKDEGKTHWKNSQWMAGIRDNFYLGFGWKGEWHSCLSLRTVFCCSPHSPASCRTTLRDGTVRGAAANSSSPLHLSLFLRFVQTGPYFVSKLLRVLHTSKVRK